MFAIHAERDYVVSDDFMKAVRKVSKNKKLELRWTTSRSSHAHSSQAMPSLRLDRVELRNRQLIIIL